MGNFLFVGGRSDGERVELSSPTKFIQKPCFDDSNTLIESYERTELYGSNNRGDEYCFTVYKHEEINQIELLEKLLEHYNPKGE